MLQKLAIDLGSRNGRSIDQCSSALLYRTAHGLTNKHHREPEIEGKILVKARLHKPGAGVVGNDFRGRQGSQAPNVSVDNSFGISVAEIFIVVGFIIEMAENSTVR